MAGKRIYITIPEQDAELFGYAALLLGTCRGMLARRWVLEKLYSALRQSKELQEYDAGLQAERRAEVLKGGR